MRIHCVLVATVLVAACGASAPEPPAAVANAAKSVVKLPADGGIDWYVGSVEDALAEAKDSNKPIFMYWGARWCPPCNQLKSTVFPQPEFIERTRQFIAVYLDGDLPGAQRWGEHFGAMGYPTMIVFRPDGTELTRITSGMELERYPQVLDLAARQTRPVKALVDAALAEPASLDVDDWKLLAFYGWPADMHRVLGDQDEAQVFAQLAEAAPAEQTLLKNRLRLIALGAQLDVASNPELSLAEAAQAEPQALLKTVIAEPEQLRANLTELQYDGARMLMAATSSFPDEREELAAELKAAMDRVFDDKTLPVKQRLLTTHTLIDLHQRLNPGAPPPAELVALVQARAKWAGEAATTPYERQSLIYNAANYLHEVGLSEEAKQTFIAEMENSLAPHYYMSYVADIEHSLGNKKAAIEWSRKAWEAADGPATRSQWGVEYAQMLVELRPDDAAAIESVVGTIIDELKQSPEAFYQRTRLRMQRLDTQLQQWSKEHGGFAVLLRLHERLVPMCEKLGDAREARGVCERFLRVA